MPSGGIYDNRFIDGLHTDLGNWGFYPVSTHIYEVISEIVLSSVCGILPELRVSDYYKKLEDVTMIPFSKVGIPKGKPTRSRVIDRMVNQNRRNKNNRRRSTA